MTEVFRAGSSPLESFSARSGVPVCFRVHKTHGNTSRVINLQNTRVASIDQVLHSCPGMETIQRCPYVSNSLEHQCSAQHRTSPETRCNREDREAACGFACRAVRVCVGTRRKKKRENNEKMKTREEKTKQEHKRDKKGTKKEKIGKTKTEEKTKTKSTEEKRRKSRKD